MLPPAAYENLSLRSSGNGLSEPSTARFEDYTAEQVDAARSSAPAAPSRRRRPRPPPDRRPSDRSDRRGRLSQGHARRGRRTARRALAAWSSPCWPRSRASTLSASAPARWQNASPCSSRIATASTRPSPSCSPIWNCSPPTTYAKLRRVCEVDHEDLLDMIAEIRALNPKPGLQFGFAPVEAVVPDILVTADAHRRLEGAAQPGHAAAHLHQSRLLCHRQAHGPHRARQALSARLHQHGELAGAQPRPAPAHHAEGGARDRPPAGRLSRATACAA